MVHLRVVTPSTQAERVHRLLCNTASAIDVVRLPAASEWPSGDVVMCDVAREDASVVIAELRELGIDRTGSIAMSPVDVISDHARLAVERAPGAPSDAVVWEELEERTSESVELSGVFAVYMVLAALIAAIGIILDSEVLIVGAMVVGPEFGPIAGFCVAAVQRKPRLALRSFAALATGFPALIGVTALSVVAWGGPGGAARPLLPPPPPVSPPNPGPRPVS